MRAIVFAVLAGVCWGIGELCTKNVLHSGRVGPMAVLLVRTALAVPPAAVVFLIASRAMAAEPPDFWRAPGPILAQLLLGSALLAGFGGVLFFYLGLAAGEISVVKPIAFTLAPTIAVLAGWLVLGEAMPPRKVLGVALIMAGLIVLTTYKAPA